MYKIGSACLIATSLLLASCATTGTSESKAPSYLKPLSEYQSKIDIYDRDLETFVSFSTRASQREPEGLGFLIGATHTDYWVRAVRDRSSGDIFTQVYAKTTNEGGFYSPKQANFGNPIQTLEIKRHDYDVDCSSSKCEYVEEYAFILPDDYVESILQKSGSDPTFVGDGVDFLIITRNGGRIEMTVSEAEIAAAFLAAKMYERD